MKKILSLLVISIFVFTANGQKKSKALDSEDAIFKYLKRSNKNLTKDDVCIDKCRQLNDLFLSGFFAHDRGCGVSNYFFKGKEVKLNNKTIKAILMHNGFKEDNLTSVENYHKEVINHTQHILLDAEEEFISAKRVFNPPNTKIIDDKIVSTMWVKERAGMQPQSAFHLSTLIFDKHGTFLEHKQTDHFVVPI